MKIGVFDSGVGGLSVARAVESARPDDEILFRNDTEHVPYGNRPIAEIYQFVIPILQSMVDDGCQLIVIACNTVSTTLVAQLREQFAVPLVAMEPMVKPASAMTISGVIAVCATPRTLTSQRYAWLKQHYAEGVTVLEPDCSNWSTMIEHDQVDMAQITDTVKSVIAKGADVIVLGCTHYHWIETEILSVAAGRAHVIQPEQAIVKRLATIIAELS